MNTVKVRNLELGNGIPAICIPNVGKTKEDILSLTRTYLGMHMDLMECGWTGTKMLKILQKSQNSSKNFVM